MTNQTNSPLRDAVSAQLERYREDILQFTCDLIAVASENPPGVLYRECVDVITRKLSELDIEHEVIEVPAEGRFDPDLPRYCILGGHGEGERSVVFHGHYDVVPAQRRDQFEPRTEGGRLIGRASSDMKSGLALMIYAVKILKDLQTPLGGRVSLCIVPDEETGGKGGPAYLSEMGLLGQGAVAMFTPEPTSDVIWNANRGALTLEVTVKGKPAHVGLQYQGVNAFDQMVELANALTVLKREVEQRATTYQIFPDEAKHSILMLGGRVEGGTNFNVVPATMSFTLERRFNPEEDLATERQKLYDVLDGVRDRGVDFEVKVLQQGMSSGVSEHSPVAQALAEVATAVTGSRPAFEMCPGILEIRWYAQQGIPAFAYGPGLLEVSHGPEEYVEIEKIYQYTVIYALLAARVLGEP